MKRIKMFGVLILLGAVFLTGCDLNINANDKKDSETKENVSEKVETTDDEKNSENEVSYSYSDMKGVYYFEGEKDSSGACDIYELQLDENGLFHYKAYKHAEAGIIGNYTIMDNEIHLNYLFSHGSDAALSYESGSKIIKINSKDEIVDSEATNEQGNKSEVTLKRNSSNTGTDISKMLDISEIFNSQRTR